MKFLAKVKVLLVEPERYADFKGKQVPHSEVIFESDDSYFCAAVWGEDKIQLCKEAQIAGKDVYGVFKIAGAQYEKKDGSTGYVNYINLKSFI